MAQIKSFGTFKLTPEQVAQFARHVYTHTAPLTTEIALKNHREKLLPLLDELDDAIGRTLICAYTQQLEQADDSRDALIDAFDKHLESAVSSWMIDKLRSDQAKVVLEVRNRYAKNITDLSYQDESGQINSMLSTLDTIPGAVEESDSAPFVSALTSLEKKFDLLYSKKTDLANNPAPVRRTRSIREDISGVLSLILGYINSVAPLNPVQYATVIANLNTLTDEFSAKAEAAKTRRETEKAKAAAAN